MTASTTPTETAPPSVLDLPSSEEERPRGRRIAFRVVSTITGLGALALTFFGLMTFVLMWLPDASVTSIIDDPDLDMIHRAHYAGIGVLAWLLTPALLVQFRKPQRRVAAMTQAVAIVVLGVLVYLVAGGFLIQDAVLLVLVVATAVLHPRAAEVFRVPSFHRPMLLAAAVAAAPWLTWGFGQARHQFAHVAGDTHADEIHWAIMAVLAVSVAATALIGASDRTGWRYSAVAAVLATLAIGAHALVHPGFTSALPTAWAVAAILWAVVYAVLAIGRSRPSRALL